MLFVGVAEMLEDIIRVLVGGKGIVGVVVSVAAFFAALGYLRINSIDLTLGFLLVSGCFGILAGVIVQGVVSRVTGGHKR